MARPVAPSARWRARKREALKQLADARPRPRWLEYRGQTWRPPADQCSQGRTDAPCRPQTRPAAPPPPKAEAGPAATEVVIDIVLEPPDALLARAEQPNPDPIARLKLLVEAHELAAQERFDELLCLAQLHDVERFWYQIETARRVLRVFRGRVILADEVGLGKTIEAGMVLKEYFLRGMARSALVLVPASLVAQWRAELQLKFGVATGGTDDPDFSATPRPTSKATRSSSPP